MKVAVYTVAYNEAHNAIDWCNSIFKEHHVGDEAVVADMGSQDMTKLTLSSRGTRVYLAPVRPFRFDIARNTALSLVSPDVDCCICLDLDERLSEGWRDAVEEAWAQGGNYSFINYQYAPGIEFIDGRRVHSRFGWRWRYPAHEGLFSYGITAIQTQPIELRPFIYHKQDFEKDRSQYLGMLKIGLDENPDSHRMLHYYGRELFYRKRYAEALPILEKYYMVKPANYSNPWEENAHAEIIAVCRRACNVATP